MKLANIEFYRSADDKDAMYRNSGEERGHVISKEDREFNASFLKIVEYQYPKCHKRLKEIYGSNREYLFLATRRMIKCNCSNFDHILDIDESGFIHVEMVPCPLRGECIDEGSICLPEIETGLTHSEKEVLKLIARGLSNKDIAAKLFIAIETVKSHNRNMMRKLNLSNRAALTSFASKMKLI